MSSLRIGWVVRDPALLEDLETCAARLPVRWVFKHSDPAALLAERGNIRVDAVLLDFGQLGKQAGDLIEQIRTRLAGPMVIALHTSAQADEILDALRAGAQEYLHPPVYDGLRAALERLAQRLADRPDTEPPAGRILAFLSAKGGCGATTVACHVGAALARQINQDEKVLLADLDLTCGGVRFAMGSKCEYSVCDAFENVHRLDQSYWSGLVSSGISGLDVMSGPRVPNPRPDPTSEELAQVLDFARANYAWTVLDLGCGHNSFAAAALNHTDQAYLVSRIDLPALYQSRLTVRAIIDGGYDRRRLFLICNAAPANSPLSSEDFEGWVGMPVYKFLPDGDDALRECSQEGKLLSDNTGLGKQLVALSRSIAGLGEQPAKPRSSLLRLFL
jgi:pilus assembly protein CpaE